MEFVDPGYINDFENRADLNLQMGLSGATEAQITAVASRVSELKGFNFRGYRQSASFVVGEGVVVKRGADIDPPQIGADAGLLCRLRGRAAEGTLEWVRDADVSRLGIRYPRHSDDALRASLTVLAGQPVVVDVRSAQPDQAIRGISKSSGDAKPRCIHLPNLWSTPMACITSSDSSSPTGR